MDLSEEQDEGRSSVWSLRWWSLGQANALRQPNALPSYSGLLGAAVRGLELVLRRRRKVREYTTDVTCVFRIGPGIAEDNLTLADGTRVRPTDMILDLHFWNEHLPAIPREGPRISWGLAMHGRVLHSLTLLAAHLEGDAYPEVKAIRGEAALGSRVGRRQMCRVAKRYGFELFQGAPPLRRRFRFFWENFLIWGLIWTFNRGGLRSKKLIKERFELWMSRDELIRRHGGRACEAMQRAECQPAPLSGSSIS
jgi:hypothetical protein